MFIRYFHTLRHLKFTQVYYQLYYKLLKIFRKYSGYKMRFNKYKLGHRLEINSATPPAYESYSFKEGKHSFGFLNLNHSFEKIDWDFASYGKLWTYNLNYFDFLNQPSLTKEQGLTLMNDFIPQLPKLKNANEPYPISLRGINWIKFLSKHNISDKTIDTSLYSQYLILLDNLEYHLLGNHLLENGYALYIGGCYFKDEFLLTKGFRIIQNELKEQILEDGGHFELSVMYHQILLSRLLDCFAFSSKEQHKKIFDNYIQKMLRWQDLMTKNINGIPLLNDAAKNIAPTKEQLNDYAAALNIHWRWGSPKLSDSGYRTVHFNDSTLIFDVGKIGPSYIPGHAHADIFNFVLYDNQEPLIVDTGISTYEKNERRQTERSTSSHNTVEINGKNQIDVWGGFRVGKRAKITLLKDSLRETVASHNGYKSEGAIHQRSFTIEPNEETRFIIQDSIIGKHCSAKAYIHFHPSCKIALEKDLIKVKNWTIQITNAKKLYLQQFTYSEEYNKLSESTMAVVEFEGSLQTSFKKVTQ